MMTIWIKFKRIHRLLLKIKPLEFKKLGKAVLNKITVKIKEMLNRKFSTLNLMTN